jgi:hypothetical protein
MCTSSGPFCDTKHIEATQSYSRKRNTVVDLHRTLHLRSSFCPGQAIEVGRKAYKKVSVHPIDRPDQFSVLSSSNSRFSARDSRERFVANGSNAYHKSIALVQVESGGQEYVLRVEGVA